MPKSKFFEPLAVQVAGGQSVKAGSEVVGCQIQTAYNFTARAEFKQRVAELRSEITFQAVGRLSSASSQAVSVLVELLGDEHEPKDRLAAAKAVLSMLGPVSELSELRSRIDALEASRHGE